VQRLGDRYRLDPVSSERLKNIGHAVDLFRITRGSSPPASTSATPAHTP